MGKRRKVKIQDVLESQIPKFLQEESPLLKEFLRQYYLSLEHTTGTIDLAVNVSEYKDISTYTNNTFYTKLKPCKLTSNVLTFDDVINVNTTVGFPSKYGLLKIDDEIITYSGTTETSFIGCVRGFSGIDGIEDGETSASLVFSSTDSAEHSTGSLVVNLNLLFYQKLFDKFKAQYLPDFQGREFYEGVDLELILSRAKDFYLTKGTDISFKILFEILFGDKISVLKPRDYIIRSSDPNYLNTKNILVERLFGDYDPTKLIGYTLYQDLPNGTTASASIYNVEYRPVDNLDLFEISLDPESFIYDFNITKKANVVDIFNETVVVDSTIGFRSSENVLIGISSLSSYLNDTYTDKTVNEFVGFGTTTLTLLSRNDIILEDNLAYCILDDGNTVRFRLVSVIQTFDYTDTKSINVNDTISLSSFGEDLSNDVRFNKWIYNYSTYHNIKFITQEGSTTRIEFFDPCKFYSGDYVDVVGSSSSETVIIKEVISDKVIVVSGLISIENKFKVVRRINKSSLNPSFVAGVQNTYLNRDNNTLIVASSGLPDYEGIDIIFNSLNYNLTKVGTSATSIVETDKEHYFYSGNKVYLYSNQNNISSSDYFVRRISSTQLSFYYSPSDLYQDRPIIFTVSNIGRCVPFRYENLTFGPITQKMLKQFKLWGIKSIPSSSITFSPEGTNDEPPSPPTILETKILVIGSPYYALEIDDPTAIQTNPDPSGFNGDTYGAQTVIYCDNVADSGPPIPGFIVKGGGRITRDESPGNNDREMYTDIRVYDMSGTFLRKVSYKGFYSNIYLFSFECPVQSIRTADDKIFSYLATTDTRIASFDLSDMSGLNSSTLAYTLGVDMYIPSSMAIGSISEAIYTGWESFDSLPVTKINSNFSPEWSYSYKPTITSNRIAGQRICGAVVSGNEVVVCGGFIERGTNPIYDLNLSILDENGDVMGSWFYTLTNSWSNLLTYETFTLSHIAVDPVDDTIVAIGYGACPPLDEQQENREQAAFLIRFNPENGDIIDAKAIGFTVSTYYGISFWNHPVLLIEDDGTIYAGFSPIFSVETGYDPNDQGYGLGAICKFNRSFEFQNGINIASYTRGGFVSGAMSMSEDTLIVPLYISEGNWKRDGSYPNDSAVVIIGKDALNENSAGDYWVENIPGGPGFYLRSFVQTDVEMVDMTFTKTSMSLSRTTNTFNTSPSTIESSEKDPANVVLVKIDSN